MKKSSAPIAILLVFALLFSAAACNKAVDGAATTASVAGAASSSTVTTSATTETTTQTTTVTTSATTTAAPKTTKKVTTAKKASTTKKPTTASGSRVVTDTKTYTEELKYGVTARVTETLYYNVINGKRVYDRSEKSYEYNRSGYSASNSDLEAEAKANRKDNAGYAGQILDITNSYRAEKGLPALVLDDELMKLANIRAVELAWSDKCSHTRPNGSRCFTLFEEYGVTTGIAGENIGWGFSSSAAICEGWRNSRTHYQNIVDDRFVKTGIAVATGPDGKMYWVQLFHS